MISLVKAREVMSTSGKGIIPLVTSQRAVSLGKGTSLQTPSQRKVI